MSRQEQGSAHEKSGNRSKIKIIAIIVAIAILIGASAFIVKKYYDKKMALEKANQKYSVNLRIKASKYDADKSSPIPIRIKGQDSNNRKVEKKILYKGPGTKVKLMRGRYRAKVEASPILEDGTIFRCHRKRFTFKVAPPNDEAKKDNEKSYDLVEHEIGLEPIPPEKITDDQIEKIEEILREFGLEEKELDRLIDLIEGARESRIEEIENQKNAEREKYEQEQARKIAEEEAARERYEDDEDWDYDDWDYEYEEEGDHPYGGIAKPVIYLYPKKTTEVNVKLNLKDAKLTTTYPKYNGGWTVKAKPDGTLKGDKGKKYNYLYWEAISTKDWDMTKGFVVPGDKTANFLEKKLSELGLNRREANEFIVYWLPRMEGNKYNLITFQDEEYRDRAKLKVKPKPDTVIRVYMTYKSLDEPIKVKEQKFKKPKRKGFTLVEWGGSEIK